MLQLLENVQDAEALAKEIKEVEHAGDKITHHTLATLHKTFITPIDREEIHQLISGMDDILDFMDAASQRVVLYEITEITVEAQELGQVLLLFVTLLWRGMPGLWRQRHRLKLGWLVVMQAFCPGRKTWAELAHWTPAHGTAWRARRVRKAACWV